MLTTTTITSASRNTRDAVDLRSIVDSVGIYSNIAVIAMYKCGHDACQLRLCIPVKIAIPAVGADNPTDATNCTGAVRITGDIVSLSTSNSVATPRITNT